MNYRNAHYINAIGWIDCEINHPVYSWIPYTLVPSDTDMTVNNDDLLAAMDAAGDVSAYVAPTDEEFAATVASQVREERNMRLATDVDIIAGNTLRWGSLTEDWLSWTFLHRITSLTM